MKLQFPKLLKKLGLFLATTLVIVVLVELGLRLLSPRYYPIIPAAFEYDEELAFRLRPNTHFLKTTDYQQESITNSLGSANFQPGFSDYPSRVFALGDSYTQGTGVPADMSYPAQLDLLLNQDDAGLYVKKFAVVNLGVAGFGGEQSLRNLGVWERRLGPPATILYLGCDNDFEDDLAFKSGDRHRQVMAGSPAWGKLNRPVRLLLEDTQIGFQARAIYYQYLRDKMAEEALRQLGRKPSIAELELTVLERLKAYADANHSHLIMSWSDENESYKWLQSWTAKHGIAFADWAPKVNSIRAAMPTLSVDNQHSSGHHRGWVNQEIAKEFARQIRAHQ